MLRRLLGVCFVLALAGCGPIKPPNPVPTPLPTPTPQPTPDPNPAPTPTPPPTFTCLPPTRIDLAYRPPAGGSRPIVDATPKVVGCDACASIGFPAGTCVCPLGFEGSAQRPFCEAKAAPYTWTVNSVPCVANGQCWLNNGNILQVVLCQASTGGCTPVASGDVVATTASAGATGSVTLP